MIKTVARTVAPVLLALGISATQSVAVFAQPPIWEAQTGATLPGQALDNVDNGTVSLEFGSMSFPFEGTVYTGNDILNISSNGFISLGGNNGDGCCDGDPAVLVGGAFPRIAPFWTDLNPAGIGGGGDIFLNTFNDDADPATDRIVITFATGFSDCANNACSTLVQVQLQEDGTLIFGYNGIVQTASQTADVLIGFSPGNGVADPGSTDFSIDVPFDSGTEATIYQLFSGGPLLWTSLSTTQPHLTPNGIGGFNVMTPCPTHRCPANHPSGNPRWGHDPRGGAGSG
jgi:hypothetical protein